MPKSTSVDVPVDVVEDSLAVSQVLAHRLPMIAIAMAYPTAQRHEELSRMLTEKVAASWGGLIGVQSYWAGAVWQTLAGKGPADVIEGALNAYAHPVRNTLHDNARRLARQRV